MSKEKKDMIRKIYRLEDDLLRCKNFQEQLRMREMLSKYRRQLQIIDFKELAE